MERKDKRKNCPWSFPYLESSGSLWRKSRFTTICLYLNSKQKKGRRLKFSFSPQQIFEYRIFVWEYRGEQRIWGGRLKAFGNSGEIRQLRKYMPGDLVKRIHWKQSARTDQLLVKEFQQEEEESVFLYLIFQGKKKLIPRR